MVPFRWSRDNHKKEFRFREASAASIALLFHSIMRRTSAFLCSALALVGAATAQVTVLDAASFEANVVNGGKNALVKFYAPWYVRSAGRDFYGTNVSGRGRGSAVPPKRKRGRQAGRPDSSSPRYTALDLTQNPIKPLLPDSGAATARPWRLLGPSSATRTPGPGPWSSATSIAR